MERGVDNKLRDRVFFIPEEIIVRVRELNPNAKGIFCFHCRRITPHYTRKQIKRFAYIDFEVRPSCCGVCGAAIRCWRETISSRKRLQIYGIDFWECVYCGSKENLTLDHVIPKSKGGSNQHTNLVTCCYDCNNAKDDNDPPPMKFGRFRK